ncbi:MAG: hypothetical protein NVSMB51_07170 [Solirubrobacteraceae bacterium]
MRGPRVETRPRAARAHAADLIEAQICGDPARVTHHAAEGELAGFDALTSHDFREELGTITAPTLIIHGREDMLVPLADAHEFERRIPGSRTVIFDDTGHVAMLERPRSFNAELLRFIDAPPAAARNEVGAASAPNAPR